MSVWKKVVVFLGSTREGRIGERVATYVINKLKARNLDVVFVDPLEKEFNFPLLTKPVHFYRNKESPPEKLVKLHEEIKEADAIVVISAEYNHSIPPALSNTMDYFSATSFSYKPSGIVTYSMSIVGGARAGVQLRSLLGELGCISVSNMFTIPKAHNAFTSEGVPTNSEEGSHMESACEKFLKQLEWWANASKTHRESTKL